MTAIVSEGSIRLSMMGVFFAHRWHGFSQMDFANDGLRPLRLDERLFGICVHPCNLWE